MFEKPALIAYITAGDPNPKATLDFMFSLEKYVDVIELGIPFSDPVADGKTIQKANIRALKSGTRVKDVLEIIRKYRESSSKPVILMTYYNPVYRLGVERFVKEAKKAGACGIIVVDLPIEEAEEFVKICWNNKVDTVFLAAPNTSDERLRKIDEFSSAFVYIISLYGTTGAREKLSEKALNTISRAKRICKKPIAVGFGVSKPEHVRQLIKAGADGVVVGSAFVGLIEKFEEDAAEKLENLAKSLRAGLEEAYRNPY